MKSLKDSLKEFQKTVADKSPANKTAEHYASLALIFLKDAVTAIQRNGTYPTDANEKKVSAAMHLSLKNLAKAATAINKDLPSPKFHAEDINRMYISFWDGDHDPFLEHMLFSVETHLFFTPKWTLPGLLQASNKMLKKDKK